MLLLCPSEGQVLPGKHPFYPWCPALLTRVSGPGLPGAPGPGIALAPGGVRVGADPWSTSEGD